MPSGSSPEGARASKLKRLRKQAPVSSHRSLLRMRKEVIGDFMLIQADCREWLASIPDCFGVDALVTDPPYGVNLEKKSNDFRDSKWADAGESLRASVVYADTPEHVQTLITTAIEPALSRATRGAIFSGTRMLFSYPKPVSIGCVYVSNGAGMDKWGFGCFNPILYYGKCPYMASGKGPRPNSFSDNQPGERGIDHPCPKPISWMNWVVNRVSMAGETVFDPFMGSGTTGVACVNTGRKFLGIELEPKYFDIACRRIEAATAQGRLFA